ncbi:MAG: queuosine precursor transporter [Candidatus Gracilibacteria bacterium]|jgi:uncharacterized integral membrane protein (TIGR00697 family)|nr:queuosine precursor transporter [Candidatus Gracilibacteria bacterium]
MNELIFLGLFIILALTALWCNKKGEGYLYALIAALSMMLNIFVIKPFDLFGLTTYGGNVICGCIFLATDLLNEHHGKQKALNGVKIGFFSLLIYFVVSQAYLNMQIAPLDGSEEIQSSLMTVFAPAFGIVVASLSAFLISNTTDVFIYNLIYKKTKGKYLWLRNNTSTLVAQFLDTVVFSFIAVGFGFFEISIVWEVILFAYIFKVAVSILDTPFVYLSHYGIFRSNQKRQEN